MVARFSECAVVSNWLPHTSVQIFFHLVLVHKIVWFSLSSSSIQIGVSVVTFHVTLFLTKFLLKVPTNPSCSIYEFYNFGM